MRPSLELPHNTFFTSDTHFGHGNIIKYCNRPFMNGTELEMLKNNENFKVSNETIEAHDKALFDNINSTVGEDDYLVHLGDFVWKTQGKSKKAADQIKVVNTLEEARYKIKCKNFLWILGNHDPQWIEKYIAFAWCVSCGIHQQLLIKAGNRHFFLNHYPMHTWAGKEDSVLQLYGHLHSKHEANIYPNQMDVGVDSHKYKPWSLKEIEQHLDGVSGSLSKTLTV